MVQSPWYRQVHEGLNWFGYCKNKSCHAHKELFIVNRGYGIFKLEQELAEFSCPVCMQAHFDLSNMGFVNCEWALKGQLRSSSSIKIYADGQTYDQKLYTFEELNYKREFNYLNIFVKKSELNSSSNSNLSESVSEPSQSESSQLSNSGKSNNNAVNAAAIEEEKKQ